MRLLLISTALLCTAFAAQAKPGALKADWEGLMAKKCDLTAHRVYTPMEASVLRNTPYALKGYVFKTKSLGKLFQSDGGWYTPVAGAKMKFTPAEGACIKKLKAFEKTVAKTVGNLKKLKGKVFSSPSTYATLRQHSQYMMGGVVELEKANANELWLKCPDCKELQVYGIDCVLGECTIVVPGTGTLPLE